MWRRPNVHIYRWKTNFLRSNRFGSVSQLREDVPTDYSPLSSRSKCSSVEDSMEEQLNNWMNNRNELISIDRDLRVIRSNDFDEDSTFEATSTPRFDWALDEFHSDWHPREKIERSFNVQLFVLLIQLNVPIVRFLRVMREVYCYYRWEFLNSLICTATMEYVSIDFD